MAEVYNAHVTQDTAAMGVEPAYRHVSWSGILAGLLAGLATYLTLMVLGMAVGIIALDGDGSDSFRAFSIGALVWCAVSAAISAFVGGFTAARGAGWVTPSQARFHGVMTGLTMLLVVTVYTAGVLWKAANWTASLANSALATTTNAAQNTVMNINPSDVSTVMASMGLENEYQTLVSGFNRDEMREIIAEASPNLNERQVGAATATVQMVLSNARGNLVNNLSDLSSLDNIVTSQANYVQEQLTGQEFVNRLQARGLSESQAQEVAGVVGQRVTDLRTRAQQTADALRKRVDSLSQTAALAIGRIAWFWLLSAGIIIGLAWAGGSAGGNAWSKGKFVEDSDRDAMPRMRHQAPAHHAG